MGSWKRARIFVGFTLASALPVFAGTLSYTCDSTVAAFDGSGVCGYLNSNLGGIYNSIFTNANANIYVTTTATGLGESSQVTQYVTYSQYYTALSAESTDVTALASLPSTEPAIFSGTNQYIGATAALVNALGIPPAQTLSGQIQGVSPGAGGTDPGLSACNLGIDPDCYNGVIEIVTPAGLSAKTGGEQGLWFRNVAGTGSAPQPVSDYDYFTILEHETDELLGTASCDDVSDVPTAVNTCTDAGGGSPSAVDLFRYSAPVTRVFDSLTPAYFSFDGGVTDYEGNTYNTTHGGEDYADFHQSCRFVQDAEGCTGQSVDITDDYLGGEGPEIPILNAVGYDLATPEPGTLSYLGAALGVLVAGRRRLWRAGQL
jgi:hypothetical protein